MESQKGDDQPEKELEASSDTFSLTVSMPSGKTCQVNDLSPTSKLSELYKLASNELGMDMKHIILVLGGRSLNKEDIGTSLDELGLRQGSELSCIRCSVWKQVRPCLFQLDLRDHVKWQVGGVDAKTGAVVLATYGDPMLLVVPPETSGAAPYELTLPETCPAWLKNMCSGYGGRSTSSFVLSRERCFCIVQDCFVSFELKPGPLNFYALESQSFLACGVNDVEQRIVLTTHEKQIMTKAIEALEDTSQGDVLFEHEVERVDSLVCCSNTIFMASSAKHFVHIYTGSDAGWVHSFVVGDGSKGTLSSSPPCVNWPVLLPSSNLDSAFLVSGNDLYTIGSTGKLSFESKVRDEEFLLEDDNGSPNPVARRILGIHERCAYRVVEQSFFDPYPLRRLLFG